MHAAGRAHFGERALGVARLTSTPRAAVASTVTWKPARSAVERGVLDAVVRREPDDGQLGDPALAQQRLQAGALEAAVAVGIGGLALVDDDVDAARSSEGVQFGAGRAGDAVDRPRPPCAANDE